MARQGIFTGFTPNDGLGDSLALGASKVNANFTEIYTTFGDGDNLSANAGSAGTWTKAGNSGIYTSKNVGIGTTLPTAALYVSGNAQLTGYYNWNIRWRWFWSNWCDCNRFWCCH